MVSAVLIATKEIEMRQEFVQVATQAEAQDACPWAAVIVEVDGGFRCFESVADAEIWAGQE